MDKQAVDATREYLREELSDLNRKAHEMERGNWMLHFVFAPRSGPPDDEAPDLTGMLVLSAEKDPAMYDAAKDAVAGRLERGEPLTPALALFAAKVMRGLPRPKVKARSLTDLRDPILIQAVIMLELKGIKALRNDATKSECGCEIVARLYDELLANDAEGRIPKSKGGEFSAATMIEIWKDDPHKRRIREAWSCLPSVEG